MSAGSRTAVPGSMAALLREFPRRGRIEQVCLRPGRDVPALSVQQAVAIAGVGLEGDRTAARVSTRPGGHKRQVT